MCEMLQHLPRPAGQISYAYHFYDNTCLFPQTIPVLYSVFLKKKFGKSKLVYDNKTQKKW